LVDDVWERGEDELVLRWLTTVNDFVQHSHVQISWNNFGSDDEVLELLSDASSSFVFTSLDLVNIEVDESMVGGQVVNDLFSKVKLGAISVLDVAASRSDVDHEWLNVSINFLHGFVEGLVSVDLDQVGGILQERNELL